MRNSIAIRRRGRARSTASILGFIRGLAEYEHLEHEVVATEAQLRELLFGQRRLRGSRVRLSRWHAGRVCAVFPQLLHLPRASPESTSRICLCVRKRAGAVSGGACWRGWRRKPQAQLRPPGMVGVRFGTSRRIRLLSGTWARYMKEWQIFRLTGPALAQLAAG